jgi:Flp pilus assembly protein TadD
VAAAGVLVICAQGLPLLAAIKIHESQVAARDANGAEAVRTALAARRLEPWASSPYLQLALVEEQAGNLPIARGWIRKAIDRNPDDWRLWLVAARIETKSARIEQARLSLRRAAELNPRSPLFRGVSR